MLEKIDFLAQERGALISIAGDPEPELLADLDGGRVEDADARADDALSGRHQPGACSTGRSSAIRTRAGRRRCSASRTSSGSGRRRHGDAPRPARPGRGMEGAPRQARARTAQLNERRFDRIRFRGPGTDLTVGLISRLVLGQRRQRDGGRRATSRTCRPRRSSRPGPAADRGHRPRHDAARARRQHRARPRVRFEGGRAVEVKASAGADLVREQLRQDDGACMLGEVALVDGDSPVGRSGLVFLNTLFDENATCHIAYGSGILETIPDGTRRARGSSRVRFLHDFHPHRLHDRRP